MTTTKTITKKTVKTNPKPTTKVLVRGIRPAKKRKVVKTKRPDPMKALNQAIDSNKMPTTLTTEQRTKLQGSYGCHRYASFPISLKSVSSVDGVIEAVQKATNKSKDVASEMTDNQFNIESGFSKAGAKLAIAGSIKKTDKQLIAAYANDRKKQAASDKASNDADREAAVRTVWMLKKQFDI